MDQMDLTAIFGKFAGKEIKMVYRKMTIAGIEYEDYDLNDTCDPTLTDMRKTAREHGLMLKVNWPTRTWVEPNRDNRIIFNVVKEADGKFRVQNDFRIG